MARNLSDQGQEVYITAMLVAAIIDVALTVLCFRLGVGWGIGYLVVGTGLFFALAHRLSMLAGASFRHPEAAPSPTPPARPADVPGSPEGPGAGWGPPALAVELRCTDEGYPWAAGWWENQDARNEDGAVTTGADGLAFLCEYDGPGAPRHWEYTWDEVHAAVATKVEDLPALAAHPGLARDVRDYAIVVSCDDPFVGNRAAHRLVLLTSKAHPLTTWRALLADHGVHLLDSTTPGDAPTAEAGASGDTGGDGSPMPVDPAPAMWVAPRAGWRKPEHSVAPGWWQGPDGVWNPPGGGAPDT